MDILSYIYDNAKILSKYGMKWCYDCKHFYQDYFCSYDSCKCDIYGSLDVGQYERHPDVTAMTCKDYCQNEGKRWFEMGSE